MTLLSSHSLGLRDVGGEPRGPADDVSARRRTLDQPGKIDADARALPVQQTLNGHPVETVALRERIGGLLRRLKVRPQARSSLKGSASFPFRHVRSLPC